MNQNQPVGIGLLGCGAFGIFCLTNWSKMDGVHIAATSDYQPDLARSAARRFGATACLSESELLSRPDVDLIHIATPPSLHYVQAMRAMQAGKHVLCEKPLALSTSHADEMMAAAAAHQRILAINFVLRYNAVTEAVKNVLDSGAMGKALSAQLTNCAADSKLPPEHWFWDKTMSGGIFLEHGVHFFDLYRYWLGPGEVFCAHTEIRQDTSQEDRVTCLVRHQNGAVASHYHGFDQLLMMDRTDHHIVCELGDIRVQGWIPLRMEIDAAVNGSTESLLVACCGGATPHRVMNFEEKQRHLSSRGKLRDMSRRIRLTYQPKPDKGEVYAESTRSLLADQIAAIRDYHHARRVSDADGRDAVAMAESADTLAHAAPSSMPPTSR